MQIILEMKGITKVFPGVKALDDVAFDMRPGEVHALMGENGAGKSTLVKILTGVFQPTAGQITWHGNETRIPDPVYARKLGIAAVHQHVTGYPDLSLTENIFMGHELLKRYSRRFDWQAMHRQAARYLKDIYLELNPRTTMKTLSVAQQQLVEIAKAISLNAELLIMDEPTASLSKTECEELYEIIRKLARGGTSIMLISHRTEDVFSLADRVSVLRDARYIGTWDIRDITLTQLSTAMVGRELDQIYPTHGEPDSEEILRVEGLTHTGVFSDVSLNVRKGEIVSLTGLVGAGRSEVCQSIYGIAGYDSGSVYLCGRRIFARNSAEAIKKGIAYLPEDRQTQGLILTWGVDTNISLANLDSFAPRFRMLNSKMERSKALKLISELNIKTSGPDALVQSLSGGNQQKVCIAKLMCQDVRLLILDEPTKGVDVGAKTQIYQIMRGLAEKGYGILLISSEMNEVLGMSDRIVVMRRGRVSACMTREEATSEKILAAAMFEEEGANS